MSGNDYDDDSNDYDDYGSNMMIAICPILKINNFRETTPFEYFTF